MTRNKDMYDGLVALQVITSVAHRNYTNNINPTSKVRPEQGASSEYQINKILYNDI